MKETSYYAHIPKFETSFPEVILYAIRTLSEDKSGIDSFTAIIDDKDYTINRGDKITDILDSWFKIKYDINPNSNLPFKNDDEKLKFYIILLREENSCFAKYAFSLALTVKDYLAKHKDMSKRKYYNIEIKCSRNYNFNSKYFEAITRTRQLLEECIDFSDHLNI